MSLRIAAAVAGLGGAAYAAKELWCPVGKKTSIKASCKVGPNGKPCDGSKEAGKNVSGLVKFDDNGKECKISYKIEGLEPGLHGFHIHEKADFSNGCISAGPHWNPHNVSHGGPGDAVRHAGDLGNIKADQDGRAEGQITDNLIKLSGEYSVVGRSVMIHADQDDLGKGGHSLSATTGNAGARVACGEIKLDEP